LTLIVGGGGATWWCLPGCISYFNFDRIENGMELTRVQGLLGAPGEETTFNEIPRGPAFVTFPGAPDSRRGVVWGERCYRWTEERRRLGCERTIYVGISNGRVTSKYIFEYEL
jgi:hypothetical protein